MRQSWSVVAAVAIATVGCGARTSDADGEIGSRAGGGNGGASGIAGQGIGALASTGGQPSAGGTTSHPTPASGGRTGIAGAKSAGGSTFIGSGGTTSIGIGGTTSIGAGGATVASDTATITLSPFLVDPGGEAYYCQNFANPFHAAVEIGEFESHMSSGSHHLLLNQQEGTVDGPLTACGGLTPPSGPYVSQQPDETLSYPAGVASELSASAGYMFQVHYLNTSASQIAPKAQVTFHRAKGTITSHARLLSVIDLNIQVPPGGMGTAGGTFSPGADVHLIQLVGHMHRHGIRFQATLGSESLYDADTWEAPPKTFTPAMPLAASQQIAFTCTYKNDTSATLVFGESAATNEMCLLLGQYY